jgi:hypothetical protein
MSGTILLLGLLPAIGYTPLTADDKWGKEFGGLRCRAVALSTKIDDDQPDLAQTNSTYTDAGAVTLGVEVKNVGDKPITLLGVRYGDSYPTAAGKLNTSFLAPHLFSLDITQNGKPLARPKREFIESMIILSGASTHELAPGQSMVIVLRPARFNTPMNFELPQGDYRVRVQYHGPSEGTMAQLKKFWPDKPHSKAWMGQVTSNDVAFKVDGPKPAVERAEPAWGDVSDGLRAAAQFRKHTRKSIEPPGRELPLDSVADVEYLLQNVSDHAVQFVSETWRQDDQVVVKNEKGEEQRLEGVWYSGMPIMVRWTLKPGEIATLSGPNLGIASTDEAARKFDHPVGRTLIAGAPGAFSFRFTIRLGNIQTQDDKGNVVIPGKDDVQTTLVTADTPLVIRKRTADDDAADRAEMFIGQVAFVDPAGKPVQGGSFVVNGLRSREAGKPIPVHPGPIDIADCTSDGLNIDVRVPGFEQAYFYDIALKPGTVKQMTLKPAAPARFRLVSSGKPLAGAKVRFFNKTSDRASSGPYPTDGIEGPEWAVSGDDGIVVLDSLQRTDPYYAKLGDAVYFFYVQASGMAGQFVGPIKAGQDLGDIALAPPLQVSGVVRGSKEQLNHFDAEWDQPFTLKTAEPTAAFDYAVSQPLQVTRDGDVLRFSLTGLRQGKLRIVANFDPPPHSVSHVYSRRDPKGSDVVYEFDLTESKADLVIEPKAAAK